ncbi:sodium:proton antiporter, partial [Aliarcobacter skirrowii CCUG 10374]
MIKRILIFLFIAKSIAFGCALCAIYPPETKVAIDVRSTDTKITSIDIKWVITKQFTDQLKQVYDTNLDNKIDDNKLKFVEKALVDYTKYKNYMTHISYGEV